MGWGSGVAVSCGVGRRCGWDPTLLWPWHRSAGVALIRSLAWKLPDAAGAVLKNKNKTIQKKKKGRNPIGHHVMTRKRKCSISIQWNIIRQYIEMKYWYMLHNGRTLNTRKKTSKRSQPQMATYAMAPFMWPIQSKQIYRLKAE